MTPLELELESFTCYRKRTKVSWRGPESGLFAVTGPTGAGKSTLLDAITYALYGQTPRLGGRGLESLLSPGAASMFVQLTFRAAKGVYRVTRVAQRRPSGVATEVRLEEAVPGTDGPTQAAAWKQHAASERVRDANRAVEELVGLDYAGFTRAVLLPQGAFDEFLRGDAGERRRLLVALLGLDRVERVRELAGRLGREAEAVAAGLERRLEEDYAEVSAAAVRTLSERLAELREAADAIDVATDDTRARLNAAQERAQLEAVVTGLRERRAELSAAAERIENLRAELEAARRASLLEPLVRAQRSAAEREAAAALELLGAKAATVESARAQDAAATALAAAADDHAARAPVLEARLAAVQELAPALATLRRLGGSLAEPAAAGEGAWLDEDAWARLQVAEGQLPALNRAQVDLETALAREAEVGHELAAAAKRVAELEASMAAQAEAGKTLRAEAERLAAAHRTALGENAAAAVRAHVHVGDDCPVCGNTVTSLPEGPAADALATAAAAAGAAERALETARAEYSSVKAELAGVTARHEATVGAASEARLRCTVARRTLDEVRTRIREQLGAAAVTAEAELDAERAGALIAGARRVATLAHARALQGALVAAGVTEPESFDLRRGVEAVRAELAAVVVTLEEARTGHAAMARAYQRAADLEAAAQRRADEAAAAATAAGAALGEALDTSGFPDADAALAARRDGERLAELAALVEGHALDLAAVERREDEARAQLEALPALHDPDGVGAGALAISLSAELEALRERRNELAGELGTTRDRLTTAEERLVRKRTLTTEREEARAKADLHRQLALDLRSDRFQEYLMTHVQQRLARRASATLRHVTDGRFDLHLLDGDYLVADAWAGGEFRSARTLSGGESFVASLALALALSDTLAGNAALGALFLDEGFGTLDRATLDSVADVLEALTDEGRMVGVITHVTGLSERLPARLVVTKGQDGSTVAWDS